MSETFELEADALVFFTENMRAKLEQNKWKSTWELDSIRILLRRLREESDELYEAVLDFNNSDNPESFVDSVVSEAADVANFAMMIADVASKRAKLRPFVTVRKDQVVGL